MKQIQIGDYTLTPVSDGFFSLDAGAMFGRVPKTIWSKLVSVDEKNRMKLALRPLLIQYNHRNILVDTGIGSTFNEKYQDIYQIDHQETIVGSLQKKDLVPQDIDLVVFSHLHFDHYGGAVRLENGKLVPVFPRAQYLVQKAEWESAQHPNELTRGSYLRWGVGPLQEKVILVEGDLVLSSFGAPGIKLIKTGNHTAGHQMVEIADHGEKALYVADVIPTSKHVHVPYVMAYDSDPIGSVYTKRAWLQKCLDEDYLIIWEHDPDYCCGRIGWTGERYVVKASVRVS